MSGISAKGYRFAAERTGPGSIEHSWLSSPAKGSSSRRLARRRSLLDRPIVDREQQEHHHNPLHSRGIQLAGDDSHCSEGGQHCSARLRDGATAVYSSRQQ